MNELKDKVYIKEFDFKIIEGIDYGNILSDMVAYLQTGHFTRQTNIDVDGHSMTRTEIFEGNGISKNGSLIYIDYLTSKGFQYADFISLTGYIINLGIQALIDNKKLKVLYEH